jgi:hypothetical protein
MKVTRECVCAADMEFSVEEGCWVCTDEDCGVRERLNWLEILGLSVRSEKEVEYDRLYELFRNHPKPIFLAGVSQLDKAEREAFFAYASERLGQEFEESW